MIRSFISCQNLQQLTEIVYLRFSYSNIIVNAWVKGYV